MDAMTAIPRFSISSATEREGVNQRDDGKESSPVDIGRTQKKER